MVDVPYRPDLPPAQTYEQRRSRRARVVRARTITEREMTKRELRLGQALFPVDEERPARPETRGECAGFERPCPFVSCKFHLYLDVAATGSIKLNFPDLEVWEMAETCALDVADAGGATLVEVGALMNVTRERVRQIEERVLAKLSRAALRLREYSEEDSIGRRRLPVLQEGE